MKGRIVAAAEPAARSVTATRSYAGSAAPRKTSRPFFGTSRPTKRRGSDRRVGRTTAAPRAARPVRRRGDADRQTRTSAMPPRGVEPSRRRRGCSRDDGARRRCGRASPARRARPRRAPRALGDEGDVLGEARSGRGAGGRARSAGERRRVDRVLDVDDVGPGERARRCATAASWRGHRVRHVRAGARAT